VCEAHGAESFDGQTFYFGDLHAHTGVSPDGGSQEYLNCDDYSACGYIEDVFADARDVYHLDFVSFTDHSAPDTDPALFDDLLRRALEETSSTFVVIPGAERALRYDDITAFGDVGHKTNLVFPDEVDGLDFYDFKGATKRFARCDADVGGVWEHAATMTAEFGPTLEYAHHPAAGNIMTTDWTCHDQTYQPVVEVYSGWGNSLDPESDYDPLEEPITGTFVHDALALGLRVGFVAGTDIHDTRPGAVCAVNTSLNEEGIQTHLYGGGLTIVALPDGGEFKRSTIYGELVARRSLVTTGPQMPVSVHWITPDGVSHAIGEELGVHESASEWTTLTVEIPSDWGGYVVGVRAVGSSTSIDLDEQAAGEWSVAIPNDQLPTWLYAEVAIDGAAVYGGAGACVDEPTDDDGDGIDDPLDDREFVWSSPVWFDWGSDLDGDTYAYDVDDCNDYDASIHPGADEVWHDGIDQDCDGHDLDQDGDGYLFAVNDCNDFDPAVNPGATELCGPDDVDDDCDGLIDDADSDTVPYDWYVDNDQDTYGANDSVPVATCEIIAGSVTRSGDCNDRRARIHPGARDIAGNDVDEDCNGRLR
jgi:hypothetical protein